MSGADPITVSDMYTLVNWLMPIKYFVHKGSVSLQYHEETHHGAAVT